MLLSAELQEPQKRLSDAVQGRMLSVAGVAVVLLVAWLQLLIPSEECLQAIPWCSATMILLPYTAIYVYV